MNSNTRFEIFVTINGVKHYLDTYDVMPVPLNYQISDINEIDKRKSSHSLSITVPETSNNRFIFNSISDLSVDLTTFNPNKKSPVVLLVDSIVVFTGNLQLTNVTVDFKTNQTSYECVCFSESDDFFKAIDSPTNQYLSDLDFSELSHQWATASIIDSWTDNWTNGYFYPLIDSSNSLTLPLINGQQTVYAGPTNSNPTASTMKVGDFYPATYIKYIWNKIFTNVGFNYVSNFLSSSSFENLLMPYGAKNLLNSLDFVNDRTFNVSTTNNQQMGVPIWDEPTNLNAFYDINLPALPARIFVSEAIHFDNDSAPYYNPNGLWNVNDWFYQAGTFSGELKQRFGFNIKINWTPNTDPNAIEFIGFSICRSGNPATNFTTTIPGWTSSPQLGDFKNYVKIPVGGDIYVRNNPPTNNISIVSGTDSNGFYTRFNGFTDFLDSSVLSSNTSLLKYNPLQPNEEVRVFVVKWQLIGNPAYPISSTFSLVAADSSFGNNIDSAAIPGQIIDYNTVMPQNLKQKDFINSIVKMFNLYIEPDKQNPYTLYIEPRNQYYTNGNFKDWSLKLDESKPVKQKILAESQNKSTLFTYKDDSDYYNVDYKSKLKRLYGDIRYVIDNDFISGEKKIEVVFSPTPLSILKEGDIVERPIILPSIFKQNNGQVQKSDSFNYRILRKHNDGLIPLDQESYWRFEGQQQTSYPYIGHFDDPYNPTEDLNWGQSYLYYPNVPTNNNLFNTYWKATLDEISNLNSRIVTAFFYLTPEDIIDFRFSDNIYVKINGVGGYYRVNKIVGYDPTANRTTQVELLKILDIQVADDLSTDQPKTESVLLPASLGQNGTTTPLTNGTIRNGVILSSSSILSGVDLVSVGGWSVVNGIHNVNNSNFAFINGQNNISGPGNNKIIFGNSNLDLAFQQSFVFGENNLNSDTAFMVGDSNQNSGLKSFVLGDNNNVGPSSSNNFVFGSGNTASGENVYILGNNTIATQSNVLYINFPIILGPSASIPVGSPNLEQVLQTGNNGGTQSIVLSPSSGFTSSIYTTMADPYYGNAGLVLESKSTSTIYPSYLFLTDASVNLHYGLVSSTNSSIVLTDTSSTLQATNFNFTVDYDSNISISNAIQKEKISYDNTTTTVGATTSLILISSGAPDPTNLRAIEVIVRASNGLGLDYVAKLFAAFRGLTIIDKPDKFEKTTFSTATSTIANVGGNIYLVVTGQTGQTITWYAHIRQIS